MKNNIKSNVLVLDPNELLQKVVDRYGSNPIFPEKIAEARKNLVYYQQFDENNNNKG